MVCRFIDRGSNSLPSMHQTSEQLTLTLTPTSTTTTILTPTPTTILTPILTLTSTTTTLTPTTAATATVTVTGHTTVLNTIPNTEIKTNTDTEIEIADQHYHQHRRSSATTELKEQKTNLNKDTFTTKSLKNEDSDFLKRNSEFEKQKKLKIDKIVNDFNRLEKDVENKTNLIRFFEQRFGDFAEMMKVLKNNLNFVWIYFIL